MKNWVLLLLAWIIPGMAMSAKLQQDLLDMRSGAVILSHPGQYDKQWPAMAMIDGVTLTGWGSTKHKPFPHVFVIELAGSYEIERLVVDNRDSDEADFPLVSAREVVFFGSTESANSGFREMATVTGSRDGRVALQLENPVVARWLRVEVRSNYGNKRFTELMELEAYGSPVGEFPPPPDPSGHFVTNWEMLQLKKEGDRLTGCYDLDSGYLEGTVDGRVLDFRWVEHAGGEIGEALMVLSSSGNFLNGLWYEQGELAGVWFGNRELSGNVAGCDIDQSAKQLGKFMSGGSFSK